MPYLLRRLISVGIGCVLLSSSLVSADESDTLPPDGWWVRYLCRIKLVTPVRTEDRTEKVTISFVGTEVIDEETYRWLEISSDNGPANDIVDSKHQIFVGKYLVSSKDLLQGKDPQELVRRGWSQLNEGEVKPLDDRSKPGNSQFYFAYAWKQAEEIEQPKVVDYQHGRLTSPTARQLAKTVERTRESPRGDVKSVHTTERIAWFDPKVSPACFAARLTIQLKLNDKQTLNRTDDIVIEDSGLDAKSKLPDNN